MKFNPYRPNSITSTEFFQGRKDEMLIIEQSIFERKNGNPQYFWVEYELGLGNHFFF